jgi:hypothetical protein
MQMYGEFLESSWHTPEYNRIKNECSGDFRSLADKVYRKSVLPMRESSCHLLKVSQKPD